MGMMATKWSISSLAAELEMDRRTIAKYLKGVTPAGKEGRANVYWLADAARALFSPVGPAGEKLDLTHESARHKKFQADKTELEVEILKGNLIPGEVVSATWSGFIANCRARLVSLPSTAAPRVIGTNIQEAENELRELIYPALDELKDYEPAHYSGAGGKSVDRQSRAGDGPASKPDRKRVGRRPSNAVKRGKRGTREVAD